MVNWCQLSCFISVSSSCGWFWEASSYFDRLWSHGRFTKRYFILVSAVKRVEQTKELAVFNIFICASNIFDVLRFSTHFDTTLADACWQSMKDLGWAWHLQHRRHIALLPDESCNTKPSRLWTTCAWQSIASQHADLMLQAIDSTLLLHTLWPWPCCIFWSSPSIASLMDLSREAWYFAQSFPTSLATNFFLIVFVACGNSTGTVVGTGWLSPVKSQHAVMRNRM